MAIPRTIKTPINRMYPVNKKNLFPTIGGLLLGATLTAQAAPTDVYVYTTIGNEFAAFQTDFRTIMSQSVDELARFTVVTPKEADPSQPLPDRLAKALAAGVPGVADISLAFGEGLATLTVGVYDTASGQQEFQFSKEYEVEDIKALLAQLEFDTPIQLKARYKELGRVIKKERQMIYFDLGKMAKVKIGDLYQVYREGAEIKNSDGNSFGMLKKQSGVVRVVEVTSMYATAEIVLGRLSIEEEDYVERIQNPREGQFNGQILSVLDDKVAISLGKNVGVEEGAYYAVFRNVQPIKDQQSFREKLGQVRINDVYDDYATGTLALSDSYSLSKVMLKPGDPVEEIDSPRKNLVSVGQLNTNVLSGGGSVSFVGYQLDSETDINMVYRFRVGSGDKGYASAGLKGSINHSPNFFYGVDVVYFGGTGANLFLSADIPTPVSKNFILNLETGYLLGGEAGSEGLNTSLNVKFPLF